MKIVIRPQVLLGMMLLAAIAIIALFLDLEAGEKVALLVAGGIIGTMDKLVAPD